MALTADQWAGVADLAFPTDPEEDFEYAWRTCDRDECDGLPHFGMPRKHARPNQIAPPGDWLIWLVLAGRGFGKTKLAAEWVRGKAKERSGCRIAIVGQTNDDVRDVMVEGESGILACTPDHELRDNDRDRAWNRTLMELYFANGSRVKGYSSQKPNKLRGPQHDAAWVDEIATMYDADKGPEEESTTISNLLLGLRLGEQPQAVITGTPKRKRVLVGFARKGDADYKAGLLDTPGVTLTKGSTYENLHNLAPTFKARILDMYEGTRTGRQELMAEILEDVEGALWKQEWIENSREVARTWDGIDFVKIVVAVDPALTSGPNSDETGIVVIGKDYDGHCYVLADRSCRVSPGQWAQRVVDTYNFFEADAVVIEKTGGDTVLENLEAIDAVMPVISVPAKRGKALRAGPVVNLYEQGKVHHMHKFDKTSDALGRLEEQMTVWVPDETPDSPDRVDALVYGVTFLTVTGSLFSGEVTIKDERLRGRR